MFFSGVTNDHRTTLARSDLAAEHLKGKVNAEKFAKPVRHSILSPHVNLYRMPKKGAIETQVLYGEWFDVLEDDGNWAWGQSMTDGYVGYVPSQSLKKKTAKPNHRVSNVTTFVYEKPDIKTTPIMALSFGSMVDVTETKDRWATLHHGGYVLNDHLKPLTEKCTDPVAESFRFLGVPYLWGGRSGSGIDCSALVQLVLSACVIPAPRDSDMQEIALGKAIRRDHGQAGDLIFFPGHVGIMVDEETMIHANDRSMAVSIDDINEYENWRLNQGKEGITAIKHLEYDR